MKVLRCKAKCDCNNDVNINITYDNENDIDENKLGTCLDCQKDYIAVGEITIEDYK